MAFTVMDTTTLQARNYTTPGDVTLSGESLAHRLLKLELVDAVRLAGWNAQLEVSGDGWRADVLASKPTSSRRIAREAQLSEPPRLPWRLSIHGG
ncbi:hypothetical protein [Cellulomonas gilvus]|uniref:hypothetical protein n=1 Tax=Cellulomonas gilvus TaxID=11 RepID=UPI00145E486A|nr:hypothetical protein [Cellulomonas gilvus]